MNKQTLKSKIDAKAKKVDSQVVETGKIFGMDPNRAWIVLGSIIVLAIVGAVVILK